MTLEQFFYLAQIVAAAGVIASLGFIGLQIKANTAALQRGEHNSTMTQWTVIRMAIVQHREVAELMTAGLRGEVTLDAADQLRLEQLLFESALGGFSHLGSNATRHLSKGNFRVHGWDTPMRPAQGAARW